MKKWFALLVCTMVLLMAPAVARAEAEEESNPTDSADVPVGCSFTLPEETAQYAYRLSDGVVGSRIVLKAKEAFTVAPESETTAMVFDWYAVPASYTVTQKSAGGGVLAEKTVTDGYLKGVIAVEPSCVAVTVTLGAEGAIGDVYAYSATAATGSAAQSFLPTPPQADLLIITAEPGAEFRQFGAVLPTYAQECGIRTAVLYLTDYGKRARLDEAFAGLSSIGYEEYPILGNFTCSNYDSYDMAADGFNKTTLIRYLKEQIALLQPKVVVTHSPADSAGSHSFTAECVLRAVSESEGVQKLYTFGADEGAASTLIDMNAPLNCYGGRTAAEVAQAAYDLHVSQLVFGLQIDTASAYTLAYSTVGDDTAKDDLFEHIDTAALVSYSPATPSPSPVQEAEAAAPQEEATPEPAEQEDAALAPEESSDGEPILREPGMLENLNLGIGAALLSLAAGAALTILLFMFAYRPLRTRRGKGDAVCLCLIPLALGLAASAVLAGVKAGTGDSALVPEPAAASAAPEDVAPTPETPEAAPEPSAEPTADPVATFEANYYRKEGDPAEVVVVDSEHGHWAYRSDNLGVDIERVSTTNDAGKPITYFVADIHMKEISQFRPGFGAEGHTGRGAIYPWIMARRAKAVLWITGDNLINSERDEKGILIRDGRLYADANVEDTLAIYPDMSMRIYGKWETRADTLLEDGVENSYSFGPTLIKDGVINEDAKYHRVRRINPRAGIGYLEPGHYIAIVVDGRQKEYSVGMTIWEFADLFEEYGCTLAYNLDGGLSAAMIFMGEQLNSHSGNRIGASNDISYQRAVPDGLMFGYSSLVPDETDPINNNGNKS